MSRVVNILYTHFRYSSSVTPVSIRLQFIIRCGLTIATHCVKETIADKPRNCY